MKILPIVIGFILLAGVASAVPNTLPATLVGNNNFTLNGNGVAAGYYYFQWGVDTVYMPINTMNKTTTGGAVSYLESGSPITPSTKYYFRLCDSTGCDPTPETLTTTARVPVPQTTLGHSLDNMTESRFNVLYMPENIAWPYTVLMPENRQTMLMIVVMVVMFFMYAGFWLRARSVSTGVTLGLVMIGFLLSPKTGLQIGLPPELLGIAEGVMYASIAGVIMSILKK